MPRAKHQDSSGLSISLDPSSPSRNYYIPGDTLRGKVRLIVPPGQDTAIGKVSVRFYGREKVKIVQSNGQTNDIYRGRVILFDLEKTLYDGGKYTHKAGRVLEWGFEFRVPTEVRGEEGVKKGMGKYHDSAGRFREFGREESGLLPPRMKYKHLVLGRDARGFIEYVVSATLTEPDENVHLIRGPVSRTAVRPLDLLTQISGSDSHTGSVSGMISDFGLKDAPRHEMTVKSLRLLPDYQDSGSLSFRDRSRSIFKRDSLPRFTFRVDVAYPSVIQVCHTNHIPFIVSFIPDLDPDKTTVDVSSSTQDDKNNAVPGNGDGTFPRIIIRNFSLILLCRTRIRAPGFFGDHIDSKTYNLPLVNARALYHPVDIPLSSSSTKPTISLDLGSLFNIGLESGHMKIGSYTEFPLIGTFKTYSIVRSFGLKYSIDIECAGKFDTISHTSPPPEGKNHVGGCLVLGPPMDFMDRLESRFGTVTSNVDDDDGDGDDSSQEEDQKVSKNKKISNGKVKAKSKAQEAEEEEFNLSRDSHFNDDNEAGPSRGSAIDQEPLPRYEA